MKSSESIIASLKAYEEILWINPHRRPAKQALDQIHSTYAQLPNLEGIKEADQRLKRFASLFKKLFPETERTDGIIESELRSLPVLKKSLVPAIGGRILGDWSVKLDSHLDIAGSVKARGGVYEVIQFAEKLALENGLITTEDDYAKLASEEARALFSRYTLVVGSTGNLGLSIGVMSKAIGFNVTVHMSKDAKAWKVALLREKGAQVILHEADYSVAVAEGRESAEKNPFAYFIDDENSITLFNGYAVAALRLRDQLMEKNIPVDETHPLFVYLPCGVGGAPGGIAYGLKLIYGDHVKIFFAEPTHAPCMLLGMATGKHEHISVGDIGVDNITDADGLAVGRPSGFVGKVIEPLIEGVYTVSDEKMYWMLNVLHLAEHIKLEPSALAGFVGPIWLLYKTQGFEFLKQSGLLEHMENAHHISWATGGGLVPADVMQAFIDKGQSIQVEF